MRKVFVLLLASLIVMLTMPLMFTSVVYAGDAVEIGGKIYYLEKGDLLFYESTIGGIRIDHMGIYSGNLKFVDAHPNNTVGEKKYKVKKDQPIKNSRFDTSATQCYSVKTAQTKRNDAVDWAEGKHGSNFENISLFGASTKPCENDEYYCSELVHCAYKEQSITLGETNFLGYVTPQSITTDSDVSASQKCPAGSPNAGTYYTPGTGGGCCDLPGGGGCREDFGLCTVCYGATWYSGWWCEEGECVPEASTLVLLATGLLFLAGYLGLRRKEN